MTTLRYFVLDTDEHDLPRTMAYQRVPSQRWAVPAAPRDPPASPIDDSDWRARAEQSRADQSPDEIDACEIDALTPEESDLLADSYSQHRGRLSRIIAGQCYRRGYESIAADWVLAETYSVAIDGILAGRRCPTTLRHWCGIARLAMARYWPANRLLPVSLGRDHSDSGEIGTIVSRTSTWECDPLAASAIRHLATAGGASARELTTLDLLVACDDLPPSQLGRAESLGVAVSTLRRHESGLRSAIALGGWLAAHGQ